MLDCAGCNKSIASASEIKKFITELVPAIDMIAHNMGLGAHKAAISTLLV